MGSWLLYGTYLVAFVVAVGFFIRIHRHVYLTAYVYFLRVPIIAMVAISLLAYFASSDSLVSIARNWFVLETDTEYFCATLLSTLLSWALMYQFLTLWESIPLRTTLPFSVKQNESGSSEAETEHRPQRNPVWHWLTNNSKPS